MCSHIFQNVKRIRYRDRWSWIVSQPLMHRCWKICEIRWPSCNVLLIEAVTIGTNSRISVGSPTPNTQPSLLARSIITVVILLIALPTVWPANERNENASTAKVNCVFTIVPDILRVSICSLMSCKTSSIRLMLVRESLTSSKHVPYSP